MGLALGVLLATGAMADAMPAIPLAASAMLYVLSYFPTSVAAELRYYLWTMIGAGLAFAFAADALVRTRATLRHWTMLVGPWLLVSALCAAARLAG
jgi:hypothetical protein